MKKAIFFFAFFLAVGIVSANAQCQGASASAGKSCCANKAAKAASADASIEKRLAEDGSISYVRKESDAQGNVKFVSVQYDEASNAFVNVAPKSATAGAGASEGMVKKSCSASEAKACAGGAANGGKACCAGKSAGACKKEQ
ncbi:MAG: hypothetical protein J0M29_20025 [Chitinophagales bacterium]|nr:hypothetical protein [Chitinophagales bacterium]